MIFRKKRMSSFLDRGNKLIEEGQTPKAMELIEKGLQYYTKRVIDAISPYAKSDAGILVLVLRHLADQIEVNNPGAKELYNGMKDVVTKPELKETEKIRKPNEI